MNELESKREAEEKDEKSFTKAPISHHGCDKVTHFGSKLELLVNDQGVIVDEADILVVSIPDSYFDLPLFFFLPVDPDFQGTARTLLSETGARGELITVTIALSFSSPDHHSTSISQRAVDQGQSHRCQSKRNHPQI